MRACMQSQNVPHATRATRMCKPRRTWVGADLPAMGLEGLLAAELPDLVAEGVAAVSVAAALGIGMAGVP